LLRTEGERPEGLGRDQQRVPDAKAEDHSDTLLADRVIQAGRLSALVGLACESVAVAVELRAVGRVIGRDVVATVSVGLLQFLYGGSANTAGAVASARTTMSDDVTANALRNMKSPAIDQTDLHRSVGARANPP
jgi:hypothetical protein